MDLELIRKTGQSGDSNCPAVYRAHDRARGAGYVVVGERVPPDVLGDDLTAGFGRGEVAVWVPDDVLSE